MNYFLYVKISIKKIDRSKDIITTSKKHITSLVNKNDKLIEEMY